MKMNFETITGAIFCFILLGIAQAAHAGQCTLENVAGTYGYTSSGTIVTPPVGLFTAVGRVTFTASGTFSGTQTTSIAGNLFDETLEATYAVNPDCTGSALVNVYHGATLARTRTINLVWDDRQHEARAIFLKPGTNITIEARKFTGEDD